MKVGDLVTRKWPPLENGQKLIGFVMEKRPDIDASEPLFIVQWAGDRLSLVSGYEIEVINESR